MARKRSLSMILLFALVIVLCHLTGSVADADEPAGASSFTTLEVPGGWVSIGRATDGDDITVKAILSVGALSSGSPTRIWLAGVSASANLPPTALALTVVSEGGWFGVPQFRLESSMGLLPQDPIVRKDESRGVDYIELRSWSLILHSDHVYEATLSYDRRRGEVSVSLVDLTGKVENYVGFFYVRGFSGLLYPGVGVVTYGEGDKPQVTVKSLDVSEGYNRLGKAGVLQDGIEFGSVLGDGAAGVGYYEDLILRVGKPMGQLLGEFRCVVMGPDGTEKELFSVPTERLPVESNLGKQVLSPGEYVMLLKYLEPGYEEDVIRRPLEVLRPTVTAELSMPRISIPFMAEETRRSVEGKIILSANQSIPDVKVELVAKSPSPGAGDDAERGTVLLDKTIEEVPGGENVLPFSYELTGELRPVRLCLFITSRSSEMEGFSLERDWPFRIETSGTELAVSDRFRVTVIFDSLGQGPRNPGEVNVDAEFISPSGRVTNVEAFGYRVLDMNQGGKQTDTQQTIAKWTASFGPDEPGEWNYKIYMQSAGFGKEGAPLVCGSFRVLPQAQKNDEDRVNQYPQYLVLHKTDTGRGLPNCWYQQQPDSINQGGIDEILDAMGTRGSSNRRLAFSYTLSYLNNPREKMIDSLKNLLKLSLENDLPVVIHLDGVNWWGNRPDLWNWWDPTKPGYNPENVNNVEWYDWGPEYAVKIGWRNWGSQIRVAPQPNLASKAFLQAQEENLSILIPIIVDWYNKLPQDKKYLLGGVVLGWEVSPYVQFYYYPGGNEYLDKPSSEDPKVGISSSIPLGYAAATALGIRHSGPITEEDINRICAHYLGYITEIAYRLGLPRNKVITHSAHSAGALVPKAIPGWSFYTVGPSHVDAVLDQLDMTPWAAIEFRWWDLSKDLLEGFFGHRNCRFVNIFNWEQICQDKGAIGVLREMLSGVPQRLVSPATDLRAAVGEDNQVMISWIPGVDNKSLRLQISTSDQLSLSGFLSYPDVLDEIVTARTQHSMALPAGKYYAVLISEDEAGKRMVTPVYKFSVGGDQRN